MRCSSDRHIHRPRPEEARSAVSKDGPRATAQAAHGSRRALCALLTMRCLSDRHVHRPRPEEARSAVSKDGPGATAAQAAHGSRRALARAPHHEVFETRGFAALLAMTPASSAPSLMATAV